MIWHIVWTARGDRMLQKAVDLASQPDEVVIAAEMIESLLEKDPLDAGESRDEDDRILFHGPFAVLYRVNIDDQIAAIHTFWRWAK
ncbi:MAG: hypothetical protein ACKVP0_09840 [Pirellulaceae bacterium]